MWLSLPLTLSYHFLCLIMNTENTVLTPQTFQEQGLPLTFSLACVVLLAFSRGNVLTGPIRLASTQVGFLTKSASRMERCGEDAGVKDVF